MTKQEVKQLQDLLSKLFNELDMDNMNALHGIELISTESDFQRQKQTSNRPELPTIMLLSLALATIATLLIKTL
jgi:hypothetical protein